LVATFRIWQLPCSPLPRHPCPRTSRWYGTFEHSDESLE
jgi:hypothetical protein